MAGYKVIQDIEAEDKLLGPLTLRQFIYALIAAACAYFTYLLATHHAAFLTPVFILPALFAAFFAFPWSREQPTEVWALAKLRFYFKPRLRIWDQSGVKELVTVTAPKHIEQTLTNSLSRGEVESRLKALANTLDSRGWATKNVNLNLYTQPLPDVVAITNSDRLINIDSLPQEVPNYDISAADDMLDEQNNPVAQQFESMITTQAKNRRASLMAKMQAAAQGTPTGTVPGQPADYWFMSQTPAAPLQPGQAQFASAPAITPGTAVDETKVVASPEEEAIAEKAKQLNDELKQMSYGRIKNIVPPSQQVVAAAAKPVLAEPAAVAAVSATPTPPPAAPVEPPKPVTPPPDPAILELASRDDLNVATIARQANKVKQLDDGEIEISLH